MFLASAAQADDLLLLNGDSVTLSGTHQYGIVYVDGALRLAGDTSISAASIYFGPHTYLATCFVAGTGDNGCTAGRSLALRASGPLTIARGIDLTAGAGAVQPAGNLSLSGAPVAVGGDITTAGSGGGRSGQVSISSGGSLAVGSINAPGATVGLSALGPIDVAGDIDSEGTNDVAVTDPARVQSAGPVTVNGGGDVRIAGDVNAYGRDAPSAGALGGGNAATVSVSGADIRTGAINATGGSSAASVAGNSAPITIGGRGTVGVLGRLDAGGQDGAVGAATPGARIAVLAGGPLTTGQVYSDGGQSPAGGSPGGQINLAGATVTANTLSVTGGGAPASTPAGPGGSIAVTGQGGASLGSLLAYGGNAYSGGTSGRGGSIDVTSPGGSIAVASAQTGGGYTSAGPGSAGGPITLAALGNLTVGGTLDASGSDAGGSIDPPLAGGDAGNVLLRASIGTLNLGGNANVTGGTGSNDPVNGHLGGTGGRGGRIDVVAHAIGPIVSLSSRGGDGGGYGYDQGPGGPGGAIFAWTDDTSLFNAQKVVDSGGGDGNPTGTAGARQQESSPGALTIHSATGVLSFASRSPDAWYYRVLSSIGGASPAPVLQTSRTSGLAPRAPICMPVRFTVVAINGAIGWTSDPSTGVVYIRRPSTSQGCSDAPRITTARTIRRSLRQLRRARWLAVVSVRANGIGALQATLVRLTKSGKRRPRASRSLASVTDLLLRAGAHTVRLRVPPVGRIPGRYVLRLVTTSPDGKRHATTTLALEIVR